MVSLLSPPIVDDVNMKVRYRTTPQRATTIKNLAARDGNMHLIEKLSCREVGGGEYTRVVFYTPNQHFDAEECKKSSDSIKENEGQQFAYFLLNHSVCWVWRSKVGEFVIFKRNCDTETSMYDIGPLVEGKEKFSSYEKLVDWAHGDGSELYRDFLKDTETKIFMRNLGLIKEDDEKVGSR